VRFPFAGKIVGGRVRGVPDLRFCDDDGNSVDFGASDAEALWSFTDGFDAATVSACPHCRSRVLAVVAVVDEIEKAPPHPGLGALLELAEDAPTTHLYVVDDAPCSHTTWRDPGAGEWSDAVTERGPRH
jgi:hypothetical protein